jgi:hypothetical protein
MPADEILAGAGEKNSLAEKSSRNPPQISAKDNLPLFVRTSTIFFSRTALTLSIGIINATGTLSRISILSGGNSAAR